MPSRARPLAHPRRHSSTPLFSTPSTLDQSGYTRNTHTQDRHDTHTWMCVASQESSTFEHPRTSLSSSSPQHIRGTTPKKVHDTAFESVPLTISTIKNADLKERLWTPLAFRLLGGGGGKEQTYVTIIPHTHSLLPAKFSEGSAFLPSSTKANKPTKAGTLQGGMPKKLANIMVHVIAASGFVGPKSGLR